MPTEMSPQEFAAKWRASALKESAAYQEHFIDLCRMLGEPTPAEADPGGSFYTFQKGVIKGGAPGEQETLFGPIPAGRGRQGFADVWYHEHFGWEYKGKYASLSKAYEQLLQYREDLQNPPLLVVCDFDRFLIHTNFNNCVKQVYEFSNDEIPQPESLRLLKALFNDPQSLRPAKTTAAVTEEAAAEFARLSEGLRGRGVEPQRAAHFLMKLLFCLFAEDIGLLPNHVFTRLVKQGYDEAKALPGHGSKGKGPVFGKYLAQLFRAMADGGEVLMESIDHFDGGLFADAETQELTGADLETLYACAQKDWSCIEPAIIGTLFERSLDPGKRSQLGAHYTSKEDIVTLVEPVLMQPLRRAWADVKEKARKLREKRDGLKGADYRKADKALEKCLKDFMHRLSTMRVLDPACGSGNFLYVSLNLLKELEKEVYTEAVRHGHTLFRFVGPEQLYGIELNPYAAELARLVVWIGHIQWDKNNGLWRPEDPILKPLENIQEKDAILDLSDPEHPREPTWPECEVIVGNPPFLGGNKIRQELGNGYVEHLFAWYDHRVSAFSDLCCYWFEKARVHIEVRKCQRAGLLATQNIRGLVNREVLQRIKNSGGMFFAVSDREWSLDGANVHIALIGFDDGTEKSRVLDGQDVQDIHINLKASTDDLTAAVMLQVQRGICFMGPSAKGPLEIPCDLALEYLRQPLNPHGVPNSDILRPVVNANDLTQVSRGSWTIDFACMPMESAARYEKPFRYAKETVFPVRTRNRRAAYAMKWWQYAEARPGMRQALQGHLRFPCTPAVAKHRLFVWLPNEYLSNQRTLVFARSDDYFFGVLHSRFHEQWALRTGTRLETRPCYTPTTCFETFPFPEPPGLTPPPNDPLAPPIACSARELDQLRQNWLNPPEWVKEEVLEFPGTPGGPWDRYILPGSVKETRGVKVGLVRYPRLVPVDSAAAARLAKRTLTNLYNERPQWLANAHAALDAAVAAAYGWPADLPDEEILKRLLALNLERAGAHAPDS